MITANKWLKDLKTFLMFKHFYQAIHLQFSKPRYLMHEHRRSGVKRTGCKEQLE